MRTFEGGLILGTPIFNALFPQFKYENHAQMVIQMILGVITLHIQPNLPSCGISSARGKVQKRRKPHLITGMCSCFLAKPSIMLLLLQEV